MSEEKKERVLFYIDENTRVSRDKNNFITQYRTKEIKDKKLTGKYSNKWANDRFFGNLKHLAEKVAMIDIRISNAKDVKSLTEVIERLILKLDNIKGE